MERKKIMRRGIIIGVLALVIVASACKRDSSPQPAQPGKPQAAARIDVPSALPANGFKAAITLVEPPAKLRSGQKETARARVKNARAVMGWPRGAPVNPSRNNKFYMRT